MKGKNLFLKVCIVCMITLLGLLVFNNVINPISEVEAFVVEQEDGSEGQRNCYVIGPPDYEILTTVDCCYPVPGNCTENDPCPPETGMVSDFCGPNY